MAQFSKYNKGEWEALCDSCGRKFKSSKLKQRWDGLMVCAQDWEIRQPQDFVRGVPDPQLVPWVRDEPTDVYGPVCFTNSAISGLAQAGCAISGNTTTLPTVPAGTFNGNTL